MIDALRDARRIYFDTAPLIYFFERNARFLPLVRPVIEAVSLGEKRGVCSYVTLLEILIKPFRRSRPDLANRYRETLLDQPHFEMLALERSVADEAARIRASHDFRVPDAIHLATALLGRADVFLTNDRRLRAFREVPVVVLENHLVKH